MRLLKQKRGVMIIQDVLLLVFEIFLLLAVAVSLTYYVSKIKDDTLFQRIHHSKDISFLIEAMNSVPGNVLYYYNESFGFEYNIKGNMIEVDEPELKITMLNSVYYYFAKDLNLDFIYPEKAISPGTKKETALVFKKTNDFEINPASEEIDLRVCPVIKTTGNSVALKEQADVLKGYLLGAGIVIGDNSELPLLMLSYSYVKDVDAEIYITKNIKAMKLACLIFNELKKNGLNSVIIPSESDELKNEVSVLVKADYMLAREIEKPIAEGTKRYFEWNEAEKE